MSSPIHRQTVSPKTPISPSVLSSLPSALPASADYQLVDFEGGAKLKEEATLAAFSWAMGTYK